MDLCINDTPLEHYEQFGLHVKREDLSCPGGPDFSKTRGVYAHAKSRSEKVIGVLDTAHSRGGHAVARACKLLRKKCYLYYPTNKADEGMLKPQWLAAQKLGATLVELQAGRSAVLYHRAKQDIKARGGYMFPNALKLRETVEETRKEFMRTAIPKVSTILVSASSGTIAAGVISGAASIGWTGTVLVHLGYSRPERALRAYLNKIAGVPIGFTDVKVIDEGYAYRDVAREGETPPFPCDQYYDLKAFRYWLASGRARYGEALFWNIG